MGRKLFSPRLAVPGDETRVQQLEKNYGVSRHAKDRTVADFLSFVSLNQYASRRPSEVMLVRLLPMV